MIPAAPTTIETLARVFAPARAVATLRRQVDRTAYRAQQLGIAVPIGLMRRVSSALGLDGGPPDPTSARALAQRYEDLLQRDLRNVEEGLYPRALLFQIPFLDYARRFPRLLADAPWVLRRMLNRDFHDLPRDVPTERYPDYFRRTFHWQSDGYLSRRSAELYDVGVELLFGGTADVMRRQVIPPITRWAAARACNGSGNGAPVRLLDVGCGTGRTLKQIAVAHPACKLIGLDLSPYYLQAARDVLAGVDDVSLVAENAERLPFRDDYVGVVVSVFVFHELPRAARRRVLAEAYRVLEPGGLLVVADSAQLAESGELAFFLGRFAAEFHEPFYRDYVQDDLTVRIEDVGFDVISVEAHFVSKVVVARKPA
jgi:ubiquinone/menaquinone biosynthesis C-methylase UbiE